MTARAARSPAAALALLLASVGCRAPEPDAPARIEVTAEELQRAFAEGETGARRRFEGRDLVIAGQVAQAEPRFRGTTMEGEVEVPARVAFRGLGPVQVQGAFDPPGGSEPWVLDPRIRPGEPIRVSCPEARIRWSDPGLTVSGCRLAPEEASPGARRDGQMSRR